MKPIFKAFSVLVSAVLVTTLVVVVGAPPADAALSDPPECVGETLTADWGSLPDDTKSGSFTLGSVTATFTPTITFSPPPGTLMLDGVETSQTGTQGGDTGYYKLAVDWIDGSWAPDPTIYVPLARLEISFDKPIHLSQAMLDVDQKAWTDIMQVQAEFNGSPVSISAVPEDFSSVAQTMSNPLEFSGRAEAGSTDIFTNININSTSLIDKITYDYIAGPIGVNGDNFTGGQLGGVGDINICPNDRTISGEIFADTNLNGADDSETRLGGYDVDLYDEFGNLIASTTTAADGSYSFTDLARYDGWRVQIDPDGLGVTVDPDANINGTTFPDTVAADSTGNDFGLGVRTDIVVVKSPDTQTINPGGDADFTISVINAGDVPLRNVEVVDALASACDLNLTTDLAPGASHTYTCSETNVTSGFTNIAVATADPILTTPTGEVTLPEITDDDDAAVVLAAPTPALTVIKSPNAQTILSGGDANFTITVINNGALDMTGVTVTDALTTSCDATIGALAAGEYNTYSCTATGVTADFTNEAEAEGQPVDEAGNATGAAITVTDTADVTVSAGAPNPSVSVFKSPDTQVIQPGDDATFTITVVNTGNVELSAVAVTDPLATACANTIGTLAAGASTTYTCTETNVTAGFTNLAHVSGLPPATATDPTPDPVTDDDDAVVIVDSPTPGVTVIKSPDVQTVPLDEPATFTITVVNSGELDLTGVAVTDALASGCDATIGALAVGEHHSYDCTSPAVTADFTNEAEASGQPVDASGNPYGAPVTHTDTANVLVGDGPPDPDITVAKSPDAQTVDFGADARFTFTVVNTGGYDLTNVVISDPQVPACDTTVASLAVGEIHSFDCTATAMTADMTNTATISAQPVDGDGNNFGGPVTDTDTANVTVLAPTPSVSLNKSPEVQTIGYAGDATFTITVVNTGDLPLTNVVVADPAVASCAAVIPAMAVGEVVSYDCMDAGVTADYTNTADVSAQPVDGDGSPVGTPVTDTDTANVTVDQPTPSIDVVKSPDGQTIEYGASAEFTITVINSGDLDLTGVVVSDPLAPGCDLTIGDLAVGEVYTYDCSEPAITADFVNRADVSGQPVDANGDNYGSPVTGTDDAALFVETPAPSVSVLKSPEVQIVDYGADVTFVITIINDGDLDLTDVTVTDANAPACDTTLLSLPAGQFHTYECTAPSVTSGFINLAEVSAQPIDAGGTDYGTPVTDTDTAVLTVIDPAPSVTISKSPSVQTIDFDDDASFTITIVNDGDLELTNVVVTDPLAPACGTTITSLDPGESLVYDCVVTNSQAAFVNVADVTVQPVDASGNPYGAPISEQDSAVVAVVGPSPDLEIIKSPDTQQIEAGTAASFTITVVNSGDLALDSVAVTDLAAPACDNPIGTMAPGEVVTYTCSGPITSVDYQNQADVAGQPVDSLGNPYGSPLGASDTANVTHVVDPIPVPSVRVVKTFDSQTIDPGESPRFSITVINDGEADLVNVEVSDPSVAACDLVIGALAVGESITYECSDGPVTESYTNTAVATADPIDENGDPLDANDDGDDTNDTVTDSYDAEVVVAPMDVSVRVEKNQNTQTVVPGADATFTITVINDGEADLVDVAVADALAPACALPIGSLDVGESVTYECTDPGVTEAYTNTATVTANPIDASGAPYDANGDGDVTNDGATDSDDADVVLASPVPSVSVEKNQNTQTVMPGGDATFTITVVNTGQTDLANVEVSDPNAPSCDLAIGTLGAGETVTYECVDTDITEGYTNTATVSGDPLDAAGNPYDANGDDDPTNDGVSDSDTAEVVLGSPVPSIVVAKHQDTQTVLPGGDASFTITVVNTGQTALANVEVSDPNAPGCDTLLGTLGSGEVVTYECVQTAVTESYVNVADVTGDPIDINGNPYDANDDGDPTNDAVSDSDDAEVIVASVTPSIRVEKNQDSQTVLPGGDARFTITVTNTGQTDLINVAVVDPFAAACDLAIGDLAMGQTVTWECTDTEVSEDYTNTATVTGDPVDVNGNPYDANDDGDLTNDGVEDSDEAEVIVAVPVPSISVAKNLDSQTVLPGGDAHFTITVVNTGQTDLTNVEVVDPSAAACDLVVGGLAMGQTVTWECTDTGVTDGYTNTATVTGDPVDLNGNPYDANGDGDLTNDGVEDSDQAEVIVAAPVPSLLVAKSLDSQTILPGQEAEFVITVVNTGQTDLVNVEIVDPIVPACDLTIGDMEIGEARVYTCADTGVISSYTNTVTASGDPVDVNGDPYDANDDGDLTNDEVVVSDDAEVIVATPVPSIQVEKSQDSQTILPGEDAAFTITVVNTGQTDLVDVEIVDALVPACDLTIGDLAMGEVATYTCTDPDVEASYTNSATATANPVDVNGDPYDTNRDGDLTNDGVESSDEADVSVLPRTPGVLVSKVVLADTVMPGDDVTFQITVVNTGQTDLVNVEIVDPLAPACDLTIGDMAMGEVVTYTCSDTGVTADYLNTIEVVGDPVDANGNPYDANGDGDLTNDGIADTDEAEVVIAELVPELAVFKNLDHQTVSPGGNARFTITVVNTGQTDLTNVEVVDEFAPLCDRTIGLLPVGQPVVYECAHTGVEASYTNLATASGVPLAVNGDRFDANGDGDTSNDLAVAGDTAEVEVVNSSLIGLEKVAGARSVGVGDNVDWTMTITNDGAEATEGQMIITDDLPESLEYVGHRSNDWTCEAAGQRVTCTSDDPIAGGGATSTLVLTTKVLSEGSTTNTADLATADGDGKIIPCDCPDSSAVLGVQATASGPSRLAFTGLTTVRLVAAGALLIVGGALLVHLTGVRRRLTR